MGKESILANYKFALLDNETRHFVLLKNEEEVQRFLEGRDIYDKDIVIRLTKENLRVAIKRDHIELK